MVAPVVVKPDTISKSALKKYISTFVDEIMHSKNFVQISRDFVGDLSARESIHLYTMGIDGCDEGYEYRIYKSGFEDFIRNSPCIYIYGAGKVGAKVYHYIKNMGMENKVKSFITTSKIDIAEYMCISVDSIDDMSEKIEKDDLIVIAVRKKYQKEIRRILEDMQLSNYVVIDDKLEYILDEFKRD